MKYLKVNEINLNDYLSMKSKILRLPKINGPSSKIYKFLDRQLIAIKDVGRIKRILNNFVKDGPDNLEILTDFDFTLTRYRCEGRHARSTYSVWNQSPLNDSLTKASYYYSQVIKQRLNFDEKISIQNPKYDHDSIEQWYLFLSDILAKQRMKVEDYNKMSQDMICIHLRYGFEDFLHYLTKHPTLIMSAGCYDLIYSVIQKYLGKKTIQLDIISNKVSVQDGRIVGFLDPLITHLAKKQVCKRVIRRKNSLLIGDQISDLYMAEGRDPQHTLSICNQIGTFDVHKLYQNYDIVLITDGSLTVQNFLLKLINDEVDQKIVREMKTIKAEAFMQMCFNLPRYRGKKWI